MTIRLWELSSGTEIGQFPGYQSIPFVAFSPRGHTLASGSADHRVRLWDVAKEQLSAQLVGHQGGVRCVAFFPDGHILASGSHDRTIRLWDVSSGEEFFQLDGHTGWISSLAFSPDGKLLASGSEDRTVRVYDLATGKLSYYLKRHLQRVEGIAFSPNGRILASCSWDRTIRFWEPSTGRPLGKAMGHRAGVKTIAFSPDGNFLASAGGDATIRLWDVATGESVRSLGGHKGVVFSLAFSPDGKLLASGGDSTIRIYEVATWKEQLLLQGHQGLVLSVAFAPNGQTLASASSGGSLEMKPTAETGPKSAHANDLGDLDMDKLWTDLADGDVRKALRASRLLTAFPQRALPFLKSALQPVPHPDKAKVVQGFSDLTNPDPAVREKGARYLLPLGEPLAPILHRALADPSLAEVRPVLEKLLEEIKRLAPSRETLRDLRAIEILRKIGGFQAEQQLLILGRGAPGAVLTQAAEAALRRLRDSRSVPVKDEPVLTS